MTQGTTNGGMGMTKHGKGGSRNGNGKSPKLRMYEALKATKNDRVAKPSTCTFGSVKEAFKNG